MLVKSHANHWEGCPVISQDRFGLVQIFLGDIMGHCDMRVVREGKQTLKRTRLELFVQLHALFKAFFDVDENHGRNGSERTGTGDGDGEWFL